MASKRVVASDLEGGDASVEGEAEAGWGMRVSSTVSKSSSDAPPPEASSSWR
jgi:hypothetical protein